MRKESGFTLVELIVVIGIIVTLMAVGVPNLLNYLPGYRLTSAVEELQADMQLAKLRAIKENAWVVIAVNAATDSYEVFIDNGEGGGTANNGAREGGEVLIKSVTLHSDVDIYDVVNFANDAPRFNSRGLPRSNGSVRMKNIKDRYLGVFLSVAGTPSIQTSTDGGANWN